MKFTTIKEHPSRPSMQPLTDYEHQRLVDLYASFPLIVRPEDKSLFDKGWVQMWDGTDDAMEPRFKSSIFYDENGSIRRIWRSETVNVAKALCDSELTVSMSQARRVISQGAVKVDGQTITDPAAEVEVRESSHLTVGRHKSRRLREGEWIDSQ